MSFAQARSQPSKLHAAPPFRHEHVGSFLRPPAVLKARAEHAEGKLDAAGLRKIEDEAIADHVKLLIQSGVSDITDGEFRRQYFHFDFLKYLGGIDVVKANISHEEAAQGKPPIKLAVTAKVTHPKPIEVDNFLYLKSLVPVERVKDIKITIPSPTMLHYRASPADVSSEAYADIEKEEGMQKFLDDIAAAYRSEIDALYKAGCRYVQMDDTNLAYLTDQAMRENFQKSRGQDPEQVVKQYVDLINASIATAPQDMVIGIHLCKGNFKSTYFAKGSSAGYEPIAPVLFPRLAVDVFFLEWEDGERSGRDFSALRHLAESGAKKTVVLGLVSSKSADLEDKKQILARLEEAAKVLSKEQLALSPQCGFSSTVDGNAIQKDDQYAKLKLCKEIAEEFWGSQ